MVTVYNSKPDNVHLKIRINLKYNEGLKVDGVPNFLIVSIIAKSKAYVA